MFLDLGLHEIRRYVSPKNVISFFSSFCLSQEYLSPVTLQSPYPQLFTLLTVHTRTCSLLFLLVSHQKTVVIITIRLIYYFVNCYLRYYERRIDETQNKSHLGISVHCTTTLRSRKKKKKNKKKISRGGQECNCTASRRVICVLDAEMER